MFDFSKKLLASEVDRCHKFHVKKLVLHPGAHLGLGVDQAIKNIAYGISSVRVMHSPFQKIEKAIWNRCFHIVFQPELYGPKGVSGLGKTSYGEKVHSEISVKVIDLSECRQRILRRYVRMKESRKAAVRHRIKELVHGKIAFYGEVRVEKAHISMVRRERRIKRIPVRGTFDKIIGLQRLRCGR